MTLHREGTTIILVSTIICAAIASSALLVPESLFWLRLLIWITAGILFLLVLQFFRIPSRTKSKGKNLVVCPADGKVVVIEKVKETEYFNDERIQISVFMSPLNVHCNYFPISGTVSYSKYHPGSYLVAWHPKSSTENERTTVVVKREDGKEVLMRQIAGAMARRIVCYAKEGDTAGQAEEMGFIKFGSRVDVFLPVDADIKVSLEEKVKGTVTVLAELH